MTADEREALVELLEDALDRAMRSANLPRKQRLAVKNAMVPVFIEASTLIEVSDVQAEEPGGDTRDTARTVRAGKKVIDMD